MSGTEPRSRGGRGLKLALTALVVVGAAAVLYVIGSSLTKPGRGQGLEQYAQGSLKRLTVLDETRSAPPVQLVGPQGQPVRVAEAPGPLVVVNLWATWCAPCITEMPTLARLAAAYPGRVTVMPVSLDRPQDVEKAKLFIAKHPPLAFYHDPNFALAGAVDAPGLPTTLIYDSNHRELARLPGIAEWDSPEARRLFDRLLTD